MKKNCSLIMIVLGFCSCQKEISDTVASTAEVDVYVAGYEDYVAKYWKNGSPVILGDVSKESAANCIFLVKKKTAMCKIFYKECTLVFIQRGKAILSLDKISDLASLNTF